MRSIFLKRLELENFKCHSHLAIDFSAATNIYGDNATGKTSVYDALTWLLFGKDSLGNGEKAVEVKPLGPDGEVLNHDAITSVTAIFGIDDVLVTLQRSYKEKWTTKRGSSEAVYGGNVSAYSVDGVPKNQQLFKQFVEDNIIDEKRFLMLTSVTQFAAGISWQDRRAILSEITGAMDDTAILASDPKFQPLLDGLGSRTVQDYKLMLQAQRKGFMQTRNELPARVNECEKALQALEGIDFDALAAALGEKKLELQCVSGDLLQMEHDTMRDQLKQQLAAAQNDLRELEMSNAAYRAAQPTNEADIADLQREIKALQRQAQDAQYSAQYERNRAIPSIEQRIQAERDRWAEENAKVFTGLTVCPTCGQPLPPAQISRAMEAFEANKADRLRAIQQDASRLKAELEHHSVTAADQEKLAADLQAQILEAQAKAQYLAEHEKPRTDMDGFTEKQAQAMQTVSEINNRLSALTWDAQAAKDKLLAQQRDLRSEISSMESNLAQRGLIDYNRQRIESLRADAQAAADQLAGIEQQLYLIDEFNRYKGAYVEQAVNDHFKLARFRLFREQANGGLEDRCDVVYDGVPYAGLNNGMKINIGIDIINTLSRHYGVSVPLFVDNAETVTRLETAGSQLIRLVVSENDKELRVE